MQVRSFSILGPGLLVAVGYMDPGNWITSMQGGAIWLYLAIRDFNLKFSSNVIKSMTVRLGIATGKDLAQMTRHF